MQQDANGNRWIEKPQQQGVAPTPENYLTADERKNLEADGFTFVQVTTSGTNVSANAPVVLDRFTFIYSKPKK